MKKKLHPRLRLILLFPLLGLILLPLFGVVRKDFYSALADLEKRAENGDSSALFHLSTLYERGYDSIPADSMRSRNLLRASAEKGFAPAQNYLGYLLYSERADRDSAIFWLEKAAALNDMKAINNLAFVLLDTEATSEEETRAFSLLTRAAEAGLPAAIDRLGDLYRKGQGVEPDTAKAAILYLDATKRGAPDSEKKLLAMMYPRYSELTPEEALSEGLVASAAGADVVAFTLFSRAAEDEIPRAFALLGDAYAGAKGTDYDNSQAIHYYLKAAMAGDPSAQFILAELLEIFPDILNDKITNMEEATGLNPAASSEELLSPHYWYDEAEAGGVTDAETAYRLLFTIP